MRAKAILLSLVGAFLVAFLPKGTASSDLSVFSNVPETVAEGYVVLYELDPPLDGGFRDGTPVPYQTDNSLRAPAFDRVAYYLELTGAAGMRWAYASMEAFTDDPKKLGLPHNADNRVIHQRNVRNLNVASNVAGIVTGAFIDTGHIEMWPSNYVATDAHGVFAADDELFDWGDGGATTGSGYGSFQIHNTMARQTVLAYNSWGISDGKPDDIGIGNQSIGHPDWTFAENAGDYTSRKLVVLVRPLSHKVAFTQLPRDRQLYSRNLTTNSAIVPIAGTESFGGYDRIVLRVFRNGSLISQSDQALKYQNGSARFTFNPEIVAELATYDFELLLDRGGKLATVERVRNVVAGDAYLFYGQSNAEAMSYDGSGRSANEYASPWLLTFGQNGDSGSHARNILYWAEAEGDGHASSPASIGQWAMVMGRRLVDAYGIPIAILNGARGGYSIRRLQKDRDNPDALDDSGSRKRPYNRLRYRAIQSGIAGTARALFYYQGEHDQNDADAHAAGFASLREDWNVDYPGLEHFYVTQVRPGCSVRADQPALRDTQRRFADVYPHTSVMATNGIPNHDGCHFLFSGGYEELGLHHFRKVARDLYGAPDEPNIDALNPAFVAFTDSTQTELKLVLRNVGATVHFPAKALDDFALTGTSATITDRTVSGHTIYLKLNGPASSESSLEYRGHLHSGAWVTNANGVGLLTFVEPVGGADPPRITSQPVSATVQEGQAATFNVAASGPDLSYQWEHSTDGGSSWKVISGATGTSYTTKPATAGMDGNRYRVVIQNPGGNVTSDPATLTVERGAALSAAEFAASFIGLELSGYQFLSSQRFRFNGQEGVWEYERRDFETGQIVFLYDDGREENIVVAFPEPGVVRIGQQSLDLNNVDFFGLQRSGTRKRTSFWLGSFDQHHFDHSRNRGWIAHDEHGWLYAAGKGYAKGIWFWDHIQQDWIWTNPGAYPFFYSDERQAWLYYERGCHPGERRFYTYEKNNKGWFEVHPE